MIAIYEHLPGVILLMLLRLNIFFARLQRIDISYKLAYGVLIILIILPFYDANNIPLNLINVANMNSGNPAFYGNQWVGGPFTLMLFVPAYYIYVASGFNLYFSYLFYKVIFLIFQSFLALSLSRLVSEPKKQKKLFLFILLNPALIIVNFIWVEIDIIPVYFLAISYLLLRLAPSDRNGLFRSVLGGLAFTVSALFYWYPLLLLPTILLYSRYRRDRVFLLTLTISLISLMLVYLILMSPSGSLLTSTLTGSNSLISRRGISGLQYFIVIKGYEYVALLAAICLLLPVIMKKLKISEYYAILLVITAVLLTSDIPSPDNDIFVIPFCFLPLILSQPKFLKLSWLLLSELLPLTSLLFVSIYVQNTLPDGNGIFYWGYSLFHLNVILLNGVRETRLFFLVFNIAILISGIVSLVSLYLLTENRHRDIIDKALSGSAKLTQTGTKLIEHKNKYPRIRRLLFYVLVFLILVIPVSLIFNHDTASVVSVNDNSNFPSYYFLPTLLPNNGNVVLPIGNMTYSTDHNALTIYSESPSVQFGRKYVNEGFYFNATATSQPSFTSKVLNSSSFEVSISHNKVLRLKDGEVTKVPSSNFLNVTADSSSVYYPSEYLYNKTSRNEYTFGDSMPGRYLLFGFEVTHIIGPQDNIFHVENKYSFASLIAYPNRAEFVYAGLETGGVRKMINLSGYDFMNNWNYVIISPGVNCTSLNVDGYNFTVPVDPFNGSTQLNLGLPYLGASNSIAFEGYLTNLYSTNITPSNREYNTLVVTNGASVHYLEEGNNTFNFTIASTIKATNLTLNGIKFYFNGPQSYLYFGKLSMGNFSVKIVVHNFTIVQFQSGFFLIPVFWITLLPFILLFASLILVKKSRI